MCFEPTARPPLPPIAGGAGVAGTEELVLQAADGNRFNAFRAKAADPDAPSIMIYDGAPHSFFDWSFGEYREACDDAWQRMLTFVGRGG